MKIARNNYEAFFLDYHEGNLKDELRKEVEAFLESNPELKEEFESFEIVSLTEKPVVYHGKDKLKKNVINEFNYKTWFVAYEENDLTAGERKLVEQFIAAHPVYLPELEILKRTKVLPDYAIRFTNKSALKKGGRVLPMWVRFAAAACIVFGLIGYFIIQQKPKQELATDQKIQNTLQVLPEAQSPPEKTVNGVEGKTELVEQYPAQKKVQLLPVQNAAGNIVDKQLAGLDSVQPAQKQNAPPDQQLAERSESVDSSVTGGQQEADTRIVINENRSGANPDQQKLVVLDEHDLAELGLSEKKPVENSSLLANVVNGAGKVFGVNASYVNEHKVLQSKHTETLALGRVSITRTVLR